MLWMQGRAAFGQLHASMASDYIQQRSMILNPTRAELAKLADAEGQEKHNAAVLAVQGWPTLLERPNYNTLYHKILQSFKNRGNRYSSHQSSNLGTRRDMLSYITICVLIPHCAAQAEGCRPSQRSSAQQHD